MSKVGPRYSRRVDVGPRYSARVEYAVAFCRFCAVYGVNYAEVADLVMLSRKVKIAGVRKERLEAAQKDFEAKATDCGFEVEFEAGLSPYLVKKGNRVPEWVPIR